MASRIYKPNLPPGSPDFSSLPWGYSLNVWSEDIPQLEQIQHGISRHPVKFVNIEGTLFVLKEFSENHAQVEYDLLRQMHELGLPCVRPLGYALIESGSQLTSILFTYFLEASIPYRSLFISQAFEQYRYHLLDAISGLLVQLHLNGYFWGDCSLSNILFRRDAGALQAYLVDAETAEFHLPPLSPVLRYHDLEIMQENIHGELTDLQANEQIKFRFPMNETGVYIQQRYRNLWEEITREETFTDTELFRVEERIRVLNNLGFSVKDIELKQAGQGNSLKLRIFVSDRNFHRNQLMETTGLFAEDRQAQQMMNEIYEVKAMLSHDNFSNITLEAVAYHWLENIYKPVITRLKTYIDNKKTSIFETADLHELYCQVLEHKWYLSERAQHDVGHPAAVEDFIQRFG